MKRFVLFIGFSCSLALAQNSPFDASGWGRENSAGDPTSHGMGESGMARRSDRLYDLRMPARSALDTLTSFSAQMSTGISSLNDGANQSYVSGFGVPQISLSIPMRRWGALGGAYWQRFSKSYEIADSSGTKATGAGGSYEFVGSYALRMPFLPWLAASASYHKLLGRDRQMQSYTYDNADRLTTNTVEDTVETKRDGGYWGASLWMTQPSWDLGIWMNAPGDVDVDTYHNFTSDFSEATDSSSSSRTPLVLGTAGAFRINDHQTVTMDIQYTDWTYTFATAKKEWFLGAGWEYQSRSDRFASYWQHMAYRAGGYADIGGPDDLSTVAATCGVGLPLGRLGALDLALQVGRKSSAAGEPKLDETFYKFYVSLTGASLWGNPSRRRH